MQHPKPKVFFVPNHKTFKVLEGLNSSLAQSAGKLWLLAKMATVTLCGVWIFTHFLFLES